MEKSQDAFSKMDMDINESNMSTNQGVYKYSKNGKIFNSGDGNFQWVCDDGSVFAFKIPHIQTNVIPEKKAIINVYPIHGGSTGYVNDTVGSYTKRFRLKFYINSILSGTVDVQSSYIGTPVLKSNFRVTVQFTNFGGYSGTHQIDGAPGSVSFERLICQRFKTIFDANLTTAQKQGITVLAKKHGIRPDESDFVPELETIDVAFNDYTWFLEFTQNDVTKNLEIETTVYGSLNGEVINVFGWGTGSVNGSSVKFPCSAPYPVPGTNQKNKTYGTPKPEGKAIYLKQGKYYYVSSGDVVLSSPDHPTRNQWDGAKYSVLYPQPITIEGTLFFLGDTDSKDYSGLSNNAEIIECNPITYAFAIPVQDNFPTVTINPMPIEIVHYYRYSHNIGVVFCIAGYNERFLIYKIDYSNFNNPILTKLLDSDTPLDWTFENPIIKVDSRSESDENAFLFWCSEKGHLRSLNINTPVTEDIDFQTRIYKPVNFGKIQVSNVFRSGGMLLAGAYQYAYQLSIDGVNWTRCSSHTNAIHIGSGKKYIETVNEETATSTFPMPVPTNDPSYKGFPAGTKTTQSIEVRITGIDRRYKFLRIYSIEAISGSGQYGSAVVNMIHEGQLESKDYYEFNKIHTGINEVLKGGLNVSEVTKPYFVPYNIKSFCFNNNRLIISGYEEFQSIVTEQEKNLLLHETKPACKYIGTDITASDTVNNGHKNWFNQQWYRSLQINEEYEYAWIFEDEYGNHTEPIPVIKYTVPFHRTRTKQNWFDFLALSVNPVEEEHDYYYGPGVKEYLNAAYHFWAQGFYLKMTGSFPSWAKKAKLVQKQKSQIRDQRYWAIDEEIFTENKRLCFVPDFYGYNSFRKDSLSIGDEVETFLRKDEFIPSTRRKIAGSYTPSDVFAVVRNIGSIEETASEFVPGSFYAYFFNIKEKITKVSIKDYFNTPFKSRLFYVYGLGSETNLSLCQIIKKEEPSTETGKVLFVDTGYEIDLNYKYDGLFQSFYGGDCFSGNVTKPIQYPSSYNDNTSGNDCEFYYMPVLSRFNYAMGNEGWFVTAGQFEPDYAKTTINRDYGTINSWLKHIIIKDDFLKEKTKFFTQIAWSSPKEPNSLFNPFTTILANNFVDLTATFGNITSIEDYYGNLYVFFERGLVILYPSDKELINTSAGTTISVGDGSYLISREENISNIKGTTSHVLKTDKGVYFYDPYSGSFCITTEKEPADLSLISGGKGFFDKRISKTVNRTKHIGYWLSYNSRSSEVLATLSTKISEDTEFIATTISGIIYLAVKIKSELLKKGEKVILNTTTTKFIGTVTDIVVLSGVKCYLIGNIFRSNILQTVAESFTVYRLCTLTTAVFDIEQIVFDENLKSFESLSDKLSVGSENAFTNQVFVPLFNNNEIHYETKELTTIYQSGSVLPSFRYSDPYSTLMFSNAGQVFFNIKNPIVPLPNENPIVRGSVQGSTSGVQNGTLFMVSKKDFVFFKGYEYKIVATVNISGSVLGQIALQPHREFADFINVFTEDNYNLINGAKTITFEFEALQTFESPLCLYQKTSSNSLITALLIEITEFTSICRPQAELHVVLNSTKGALESKVLNPNSDQFVYDNGVITGSSVEADLSVQVNSPQINEDVTVNEEIIKKRLNEYRFSVPYYVDVAGKQRVRGIFVTVKYKFKNYLRKFAIQSVKHTYRKSS
jgi:hypothetical protein